MNEKLLSCLGLIALAFGLAAAQMLTGGWACVVLWRWFVTPIFGIVAPSYLQSMGLILFVSLFTMQSAKTKDDRDASEKIGAAIASVLAPVLAVMIGAVVRMFL
jgi:putative Mn2+ efflux pump MntP